MRDVRVNQKVLPEAAIAAEMQHHPAATSEAAWEQAATALVLRTLLLDEATRLGIAAEADEDSTAEEATIQALLAREIAIPEADEASLHRYWQANRARFRAPDVYEAAHILFPAPPEDATARAAAKQAASEVLAMLADRPDRFAALARERSACPSREAGGLLGQQSRGDLVPELETFVFNLESGQICPVPVATRYGYHVLRVDRVALGQDLPFETVAGQIERHLATHAWQRAVSQYLRVLAGRAKIDGVAMEAASGPLVQ